MSETPDYSQSGEDDDWGDDLHSAFEKAWRKTVKEGAGEQTFSVQEIQVKGTNPISGYRVILTG